MLNTVVDVENIEHVKALLLHSGAWESTLSQDGHRERRCGLGQLADK